MNDKLVIDKLAYDSLCDKVRSLSTLAKQFNLTTVRKLGVISDLLRQCNEDRIKFVDKVENLESLLENLKVGNNDITNR